MSEADISTSPPAIQEDRLGPALPHSLAPGGSATARPSAGSTRELPPTEYQMVFLPQGLQDPLAAERLEFIEDTRRSERSSSTSQSTSCCGCHLAETERTLLLACK